MAPSKKRYLHHKKFAHIIIAHTDGFDAIMETWDSLETEQQLLELSKAFAYWRYLPQSSFTSIEDYQASSYRVIGKLDACICGHPISDSYYMINDSSKTLAILGSVCIRKLGDDQLQRDHEADLRKEKHLKALKDGIQVRRKCPYCYLTISQDVNICKEEHCLKADRERTLEDTHKTCNACKRLIISKGSPAVRCEECILMMENTTCRRCLDCLIKLPRHAEHWIRRCYTCYNRFRSPI